MVVCVRGEAATARHLAVARTGLTRERRRMKDQRLESDSGDSHRATPKHFLLQSIQQLPPTRYSAV